MTSICINSKLFGQDMGFPYRVYRGKASDKVSSKKWENIIEVSTSRGKQMILLQSSAVSLGDNVATIHLLGDNAGHTTNALYITVNNNSGIDRLSMKQSDFRAIVNNLIALNQFEGYEVGWDGYDSDQIDIQAICMAKKLVGELCYQPDISPTLRGSIQFEFENKTGDYLEMEIVGDGIVSYFVEYCNGSEREGEIEFTKINNFVRDFYERQGY